MEKARKFQKNIYFCFIDYAKAFDCMGHNKLWKILKEIGISDHLTCLLRNLYADQETMVRTRRETADSFKIGEEYNKAVYCHPAYLTYVQSMEASLISQLVKNPPAMQETLVQSLVWEDPLKKG